MSEVEEGYSSGENEAGQVQEVDAEQVALEAEEKKRQQKEKEAAKKAFEERRLFRGQYSKYKLVKHHAENKGKYFGGMICFFILAIAQLIVFNKTVSGKSKLEEDLRLAEF